MLIRTLPLLVLASCASIPPAEPPRQVAGHYRFGFEIEAFQPCGNSEEWWVARADELRARVRTLPVEPERVYAVVRAHVSPEGMYGHLGAYSRQMSIVEVVEVKTPSKSDCNS